MYTNQNYLMHHGVKGMKWGVRHDKPSLGTRYRNWGVSKSNRSYDKKVAKINARREKARKENWLTGTKYGNAVNRANDKRYDKKISKVEQRRARRMEEFKIGQKEDNMAYKYNKPGESGWTGAKRAANEQIKEIKKSGLSDKQKQTLKKVAIGAAVVAGVAGVGLAAYGGFKMKNIRMNNQAAVGKRILNGDFLTRASLIDKAPVKSAINPGFNAADPTRVRYNGTKITNAKIKDSILGPQLRVSTSTVSKGTKPGVISTKELRNETIGREGKGIYDTKEARKEYARAYRRMRKKGFK